MPIPLPPRTPTPPPDETDDSEARPSMLQRHSLNIIGQRRGHKYKHSSVSHQIFLEPPRRAPLALPNSLPIPTLAECRASMTTDQKVRFYWSVCHMFVAGYTAWNGGHSAAIQALSHLIFYDGLGALLCVLVEVFSNFEVWGRSSLLTAVLAIASTLVSAVGLKNHARIAKAMRFGGMKKLPSVLSNPSHFLTLSCSATLLLLPLVSLHTYQPVDKALSLSIALAMLFLGVHLAMNVGSMLLMSYPSKELPSVITDIASDPLVFSVDQAKFWQAHYGLGIANLKLRVDSGDEALVKLRERIASLVRNRLSGGYGSGGQRWEVSVQFEVDAGHGHSHNHSSHVAHFHSH
ncbi:hypothetical protein DV737_g5785, partial [Chaetothyriales sp. CBS 132003]